MSRYIIQNLIRTCEGSHTQISAGLGDKEEESTKNVRLGHIQNSKDLLPVGKLAGCRYKDLEIRSLNEKRDCSCKGGTDLTL